MPSLRALIVALCTAALASCGMDDGPGQCPETAAQPVVVCIGAQLPPAAADEEEAKEDENIRSLWVFLVDAGGKVEWRQRVESLNDVTDYFLQPVENLTMGQKTLYAFANFDAYLTSGDALYNEALAGLLATETGDSFSADGIMIANPAASIDLAAGRYIPMSGKAEVNVTPSTTEIGVDMARLVSKVRIRLDKSAGTEGTVTFGGTSGAVSLMQGGTESQAGTAADRILAFSGNTAGITLPDFYVNATETAGGGFSVRLDGTDGSGNKVTYSATTQRKKLPRNSIYPLTLNFPSFGFTMAAKVWLAPIGGLYPVVDKQGETVWTAEVPEGCTFEFTFSGSNVQGLAVTWPTVDDSEAKGYVLTPDGNTVRGRISTEGLKGKTIEIPFGVAFTVASGSEAGSYRRDYTLTLTVKDIWDFFPSAPARTLPAETLGMYRTKDNGMTGQHTDTRRTKR